MYKSFYKISHLLSIFAVFFMLYYLVDNKLYIINSNIISKYYIISLFFLLIGHILYIYGLHLSFKIQQPSSFRRILEAEFLSMFNKYIPGKIFTVIGPLSYLKKSFPSLQIGYISISYLYYQVVLIWIGLFFGIFFVQKFEKATFTLYLFSLFMIGFFLFFPKLKVAICRFLYYCFKQNMMSFIHINFSIITTIIISLFVWFFWSIGFYFFSLAYNVQIDFLMMFLFPIAATIGILAIFTPGGLGIRESSLVFLLTSYGIDKMVSLQLSIDARLWFLVGEILCFLIGLISIVSCRVFKRFNV